MLSLTWHALEQCSIPTSRPQEHYYPGSSNTMGTCKQNLNICINRYPPLPCLLWPNDHSWDLCTPLYHVVSKGNTVNRAEVGCATKPREKSSCYMRLKQLGSLLYAGVHVSRLLLKCIRLSLKAPVHKVKFRNNHSECSCVYLSKRARVSKTDLFLYHLTSARNVRLHIRSCKTNTLHWVSSNTQISSGFWLDYNLWS